MPVLPNVQVELQEAYCIVNLCRTTTKSRLYMDRRLEGYLSFFSGQYIDLFETLDFTL